MRLSHKYEVEQEELKKQMFDLKNKIERLDKAQNSSGSFIRKVSLRMLANGASFGRLAALVNITVN